MLFDKKRSDFVHFQMFGERNFNRKFLKILYRLLFQESLTFNASITEAGTDENTKRAF
jgi:hypothetical protein